MAAGYVDDHKLILYRDGAQPRDITAFASGMTLTDDLDTLAAELTFKTFISSVGQVHTKAGARAGR